MMLQFDRRAFCAFAAASTAAAALAVPGTGMAQPARDPGAEAFVAKAADQVMGVLDDRKMGETQKEAAFNRIIDQIADVPKITTFVLGKYARTVTPAQKAQFAEAFRTYAERIYRDRLIQYHGENVKVTGSLVRKPGDVIVTSQVAGGQLSQPQKVGWRVMGGPGAWKVVDIEAQGVWLAITQQQDFVSTVDNAHGDVGVLINRLKSDVQRAGAPKR
jgi:phospholipid transport system substrate-binding protein